MYCHLLLNRRSSRRRFRKASYPRRPPNADEAGRHHLTKRCSLCRAVALIMSTIGYLLFGQGTADAAIKTPKKPVVDEYHAVKVVDDFQWLENADDPAVRRWSDVQNKHTRATLEKLPARPWIEDRLRRLFSGSSSSYFALTSRRGQLFLLKQSTPAQQPMLITLNSITNPSSERVIFDPNTLTSN